MTPQRLPFDALAQRRRPSLADRMAMYFKAFPDQWLDVGDLASVGGIGGWRTRVSDLRHAPYGMVIDNRLEHWPDGRTRSQYRYVPAGQRGAA